jgi:hypothetical protein
MGQRKPFNPNTKYGRRKMMEHNRSNYSNLSPEEKNEHDGMGWVIGILVIIVFGGLIFLIGGGDALLDWLSN